MNVDMERIQEPTIIIIINIQAYKYVNKFNIANCYCKKAIWPVAT